MIGKFVIDHGISAIDAGICFFYMYTESFFIDRHAESEGYNLSIDVKDTSRQS